jgi:hypothetical protein
VPRADGGAARRDARDVPARRAPRSASRWVRAVMLLGLALVGLELASAAGVAVIAYRKPDAFYRASVVDRGAYERYRAERDPELGWPRRGGSASIARDAAGSRVVPAFPDPDAPALVSLYGDSMTESLEVGDDDAWGNQLALLLGGRVSNFGVSGYGTDQAYLRFLANERDAAPVVMLNHFSDDVMRNVNRWRYLISTSDPNRLTFKPRFVAEGDALRAIPPPDLGYDEYVACTADPAACLADEFFLPDDGRSGVQRIRFPLTLTLLRTLDNRILGPRLAGVPRHVSFYERDHPSDALGITRRILRDFAAAARARGKTPVVTVIPDSKDLEYFRANGAWTYQPLIDDLARIDGIEAFDFGPGILRALDGASPCEIFNRCYDHFNARGYRIVAELAREHLKRSGLVRPST